MVVLRMDTLMCLFIVLALWTFSQDVHRRRPPARGLADATAMIFLALFTKDAVGLLMPPLAIAVFLAGQAGLERIPQVPGSQDLGIIAALSAVWLTCVWLEGGPEYINNLLFKQTVGRAVKPSPMRDHSGSIW